ARRAAARGGAAAQADRVRARILRAERADPRVQALALSAGARRRIAWRAPSRRRRVERDVGRLDSGAATAIVCVLKLTERVGRAELSYALGLLGQRPDHGSGDDGGGERAAEPDDARPTEREAAHHRYRDQKREHAERGQAERAVEQSEHHLVRRAAQ